MPPLDNLWYAPLAPLLRAQGRKVRKAMPSLAPAQGPTEGIHQGLPPRMQVVFLGESTVAGVGVARMEDSLPALTARELAARTGREVEWHAFGRSGATVEDCDALLAPVEARRKDLDHADLAVIAMGVSDTIAFTTAHAFFSKIDCLTMRLRLLLWPLPILLAGVPRMDRFQQRLPRPLRGALSRRCRSLDRALTRVAEEGYQTLHWPVFHPPGVNDTPNAFAADGFHPGSEGYKLWARHLALGAVSLLEHTQEKADLRDRSALDI